MHAAKCGTNSSEVFDESNADFKRGCAEQNVVEQGWHLHCRKKLTRRDKRSDGEGQKATAREYRKQNHSKQAEKAPASEGGRYSLCARDHA